MRGNIRSVDCSCANSACLGSRKRTGPWRRVGASASSRAGVCGHKAVLEAELIRPKGRGDSSPRGGFIDLPGPEEEVLIISTMYQYIKMTGDIESSKRTCNASILLNAICLIAALVPASHLATSIHCTHDPAPALGPLYGLNVPSYLAPRFTPFKNNPQSLMALLNSPAPVIPYAAIELLNDLPQAVQGFLV